MQELIEAVEARRRRTGLSQAQFALQVLGVSPAFYSLWIRGLRTNVPTIALGIVAAYPELSDLVASVFPAGKTGRISAA